MKFQTTPFTFTLMILGTILISVLSIWNQVTGFGELTMQLFHDIHPNPFLFESFTSSLTNKILSVVIDILYAALDSFIFALSFSVVYRLFYKSDQD